MPWAIAPMPRATAAAAPPEEPPGVTPAFQGFSLRPRSGFSVNQRKLNSGVLVRPMTMAPAFLRLATTGESSGAMMSAKAATPFGLASPF